MRSVTFRLDAAKIQLCGASLHIPVPADEGHQAYSGGESRAGHAIGNRAPAAA